MKLQQSMIRSVDSYQLGVKRKERFLINDKDDTFKEKSSRYNIDYGGIMDPIKQMNLGSTPKQREEKSPKIVNEDEEQSLREQRRSINVMVNPNYMPQSDPPMFNLKEREQQNMDVSVSDRGSHYKASTDRLSMLQKHTKSAVHRKESILNVSAKSDDDSDTFDEEDVSQVMKRQSDAKTMEFNTSSHISEAD